jgi:DNA-binding beta-propeller fold protein YncE
VPLSVYVTDGYDQSNSRVLELAAGSDTPTVLPFTGLNHPSGVAVDTAGNLYVTDGYNNRVLKLAAGSATPRRKSSTRCWRVGATSDCAATSRSTPSTGASGSLSGSWPPYRRKSALGSIWNIFGGNLVRR